MSQVKWVKAWTNMFDDCKMKVIDDLPEGDSILSIWFKLLILAGKSNADGQVFMDEDMPFTDSMLPSIFNRPLETIKFALGKLKELRLIDIDDKNIINIKDWETQQNVEGMEKIREATRRRVAAFRERKKAKKEAKKKEEQEKEDKNGLDEIASEIEEKIKLSYEADNEEDTDTKDYEKINQASKDILTYYEKLSGKIGVFYTLNMNQKIIKK